MLISTPNLSNGKKEFALTPTMIRGAFLLWRFELQRGQQFAEIRNLDSAAPFKVLSPGAPGNISVINGRESSRDSAGR